MQSVLSSANGLAAAAPFTGSVDVNNKGTATIASLNAVSTTYNRTLTAGVTFTSATGDYAWTTSDGATGTGTWTAGTPITINGFALQLAGVPKSGDTISVVPTVSVAANNGNALAFSKLVTAGIVAL